MKVIPAIDLLGGKCVRLIRGNLESKIEYDIDPLTLARKYIETGAKRLHIVDLDGAFTGTMKNEEIIRKIAKEIPVQVGGGIRNESQVEEVFSWGVEKVVLGTILITWPEKAQKIREKYADRIVGSFDFKNGLLGYQGWTQTSALPFEKIVDGIGEIVITDTSRDGTFTGPNMELLRSIQARYKGNIIAAGGVCEILDLLELKKAGVYGAIVGRAFLEKKIRLKDGLFIESVG